MHIIMKLRTIYVLFFTASLLLSCSDKYLDVPSQTVNSENYFTQEQDFNKALIATYSLLYSSYLNVMLGEIASDNTLAGGESAQDVPGIQEIDNMTHTPVNAQLRNIWQWMYAGIARCNYIMEFKDNIDFTNKQGIIAQVRFLRAYYYFELVKWFGGVPLYIDKRLAFGQQNTIERASATQVYEQIEKDLIFAVDNLPMTQADKGRATKGAALALLGKAYLYQNKFDLAASTLQKVVDQGTYQLADDYARMFEQEGENNAESVFEIQYTDNTNEDGAGFDCLQCSPGNIAIGFSGIRAYNGPTFDVGYSFNVPTKKLVDAFENGDIRKDVTILDIVTWSAANNATYAKGFEHTGYYNRKYIARKGDRNIPDQNLTNPNNYRAIRYADVLLMLAEAYAKSSTANESQAKVYLNVVRSRAKLAAVNFSGNNLIEAIYKERRVELAGEGHRFFDLVRTGKAAQEMKGDNEQGTFVTGKHELFPIPQVEIELTGSRWKQNPNY